MSDINIVEFERMVNLTDRKVELQADLQADIERLNRILTGIEEMIAIYSTIDMVRVEQLSQSKKEIEVMFLDVLSESNDLWLQSIKSA
jgi:hypothetical protein